jgi:RNA polymerase sigma-70 factor, ECF subfamily
MNRIRDELRRARHRPESTELDPVLLDDTASPLELAIGAEAVSRYETALDRLREDDREIVIARVELGLTYSEIAAAAGKPSANAARMAVVRALMRLAEEMGEPSRAAD